MQRGSQRAGASQLGAGCREQRPVLPTEAVVLTRTDSERPAAAGDGSLQRFLSPILVCFVVDSVLLLLFDI